MADLFLKQAKQYWKSRPGYPQQLFDFIASKTPCHDVVLGCWHWQRSGCRLPCKHIQSVIGTDTSKNQLEFAPKIPNVRYECTSPNISMFELEEKIGKESSVVLVTAASALHWFDHDAFYSQVKWILKKPDGVFAAWCYIDPKIDDEFDCVFNEFYEESKPYWEKARGFMDDKYCSIKFPFDPVDGCDHTGPFEFETKQMMNLDGFFMYIRSWTAYQTAKDKGVELLSDRVIKEFRNAWKEDGKIEKCVTYPIYLRIGKAEEAVKQAI